MCVQWLCRGLRLLGRRVAGRRMRLLRGDVLRLQLRGLVRLRQLSGGLLLPRVRLAACVVRVRRGAVHELYVGGRASLVRLRRLHAWVLLWRGCCATGKACRRREHGIFSQIR